MTTAGKSSSFCIFAIAVPLQARIWVPVIVRKVQRNSPKNDGTLSRRDSCDMEQRWHQALEFGARVSTTLDFLRALDVRR